MSQTLKEARRAVSQITGQYWVSETTAAGNAAKTTFIDSKLADGPDNWLKDWYGIFYMATTGEIRKVKSVAAEAQVGHLYRAASAQIADETEYEMLPFHPDEFKHAINNALKEVYPRYYKRVEDTTLTGTGSSDNEYAVPAAFTDEYPAQVWLRSLSGDDYTWQRYYDVTFIEISSARKFYADIGTSYTIVLVGMVALTQFTTETSTTELDDRQMAVVALKAAANLYRSRAATVDSENAGRYEELAKRWMDQYDLEIRRNPMPSLRQLGVDWSWLES